MADDAADAAPIERLHSPLLEAPTFGAKARETGACRPREQMAANPAGPAA